MPVWPVNDQAMSARHSRALMMSEGVRSRMRIHSERNWPFIRPAFFRFSGGCMNESASWQFAAARPDHHDIGATWFISRTSAAVKVPGRLV